MRDSAAATYTKQHAYHEFFFKFRGRNEKRNCWQFPFNARCSVGLAVFVFRSVIFLYNCCLPCLVGGGGGVFHVLMFCAFGYMYVPVRYFNWPVAAVLSFVFVWDGIVADKEV